MSHSTPISTAINELSSIELIDWINQHLPIINSHVQRQIVDQFIQRDFTYHHLIDHTTGQLHIQSALRLIDQCLFERPCSQPPLISSLYRIVKRSKHFLNQSKALHNKRLVTLDYIHEQLFIDSKTIEIISVNELEQLSSNDVFVSFKNDHQHFPNAQLRHKIHPSHTRVIFDKGPLFRGFKSIGIFNQQEQIDFIAL